MSTQPKSHSSAFLSLVAEALEKVPHIGIDEYRALVEAGKAGVLVDTREESEWQAGHAAGAIHLGKGVIERDIEKTCPDKSARLVLYCGGGYRSALAGENLQRMGYTDVTSLDGGWRAWREAGLPVEK